MGSVKGMAPASTPAKQERDKALGVTVEARYTGGEYDILILSAKVSHGLETWLSENGYRIQSGTSTVLQSYLKYNMKWFVARVNLVKQSKLGFTHLRPLQIAFESPKFMLSIRLGTVDAEGAQELFIYVLTKQGRVETTNYRTVRLPKPQEIPLYVLRHPWIGTEDCPAATAYRQQLRERYEREAQTLPSLSGRNIGDICMQMNIASLPVSEEKKWYQRLWTN